MPTIKIYLDEKNFELTSFGSLWSVFFIQIDDVSFPCEDWWDNSSSILEMWICSIYEYLAGSIKNVTLYFMDGDFSIQLSNKNESSVLAKFIGPDETVYFSYTIDIYDFCKELLYASDKITHYISMDGNKILPPKMISLSNLVKNKLSNKRW